MDKVAGGVEEFTSYGKKKGQPTESDTVSRSGRTNSRYLETS